MIFLLGMKILSTVFENEVPKSSLSNWWDSILNLNIFFLLCFTSNCSSNKEASIFQSNVHLSF